MSAGCGCSGKLESGEGHTDCDKCRKDPLPKVHEDCPPKWCGRNYHKCVGMSGDEIFHKYNSAVVRVHSEWDLVTEGKERYTQEDVKSVFQHGNGFFITKHVIVTPASLVLAPPDLTRSFNRLPLNGAFALDGTFNGNSMTRATRILVDVVDVNGTKHTYTYEATLIGVSGIADVALLFIDMHRPWNSKLPCIKECHPHFRLQCSRAARPGDKVYAIGDPFTRNFTGLGNIGGPDPDPRAGYDSNVDFNVTNGHVLVEGTVAHERYVDYLGLAQQELVAVNMNIFADSTGLPIVDKLGRVIAMQTLNVAGAAQGLFKADTVANGDGLVAGPSQFFMLHVIKTLLACDRVCNAPFLEQVIDAAGSYLRFVPSHLGLVWEVMQGEHYMRYRDTTTGFKTTFWKDPTDVSQGYLNVDWPVLKENIGLRVVGIDNDSAAAQDPNGEASDILEPNFSVTPPPLSGFNGARRVFRNDIITHADKLPLGNLHCQIPISLVLFRKASGSNITLTVRSSLGTFNTFTSLVNSTGTANGEGYSTVRNYKTVTGATVRFWDYPFYKYSTFPYKRAGADPRSFVPKEGALGITLPTI